MNEHPNVYHHDNDNFTVEDIWLRASESLQSARYSGDVYLNLGTEGQAIGVIGPWFMPHDVLGVMSAYAVGRNGTVYSIDPQGDGGSINTAEFAIGSGNSSTCGLQIELLKESGLPMGSFEWLGYESSLVHIPETEKIIRCIADHGTLEFLTGSVPEWYIKEGVKNIIRSLPVGGLYIHHTVSIDFLNYCLNKDVQFETSFTDWLTSIGTRTIYRTFRSDSYRIPVNDNFKHSFSHSAGFESYFPKTQEVLLPCIHEQEMIIPERLIRYPMRTVMVIQKMYEYQ